MGELVVSMADLKHIIRKGYAKTVRGLLRVAKKYTREQHCTKDHRYNGWTNYETWNVNLWIDNDEGTYNHWRGVAQECYDEATPSGNRLTGRGFTREENAVHDLRERLKSSFEDDASGLVGVTGTFADLLSGALSEVDWHTIAEHMIENVDKDEEEKEDA